MNSRILICGAIALLTSNSVQQVGAINIVKRQNQAQGANGIFDKMIEVETEGQTLAEQRKQAKERHKKDMEAAEAEHEKAVKEEEEEEAKAKKAQEDQAEKDLEAAEQEAKKAATT